MKPFKIPRSVLVVIYTVQGEALLLERADRAGFWQSVTGSLDALDEPPHEAARREVYEETGILAADHRLTDWNHCIEYSIYPHWRHRYAPDIDRNTEHWFGLELATRVKVTLSPREHVNYAWSDYREAAKRCFSPSNSDAILAIPKHCSPVAQSGCRALNGPKARSG